MVHLCLTLCTRWARQKGCKAMLYLAKIHDNLHAVFECDTNLLRLLVADRWF